MNNCEKWLLELLTKNECVLVEDVREQAKQQGFKKSELKEARKTLNVKTFHQFDEDGATENWFWHLE